MGRGSGQVVHDEGVRWSMVQVVMSGSSGELWSGVRSDGGRGVRQVVHGQAGFRSGGSGGPWSVGRSGEGGYIAHDGIGTGTVASITS